MNNGRIFVVVSFYTYDPAGNQVWLLGVKTIDPGVNTVTMDLKTPVGAKWSPDFDPDDPTLERIPWGTGEFIFDTCRTASFVATSNAEMQAIGYVEYGYGLTRDLTISGITCPRMLNGPTILN